MQICYLFTLGLIVFSTILLNLFHDQTLLQVFEKGANYWMQLIHGIIFGTLAATIIIGLMQLKFFSEVGTFFEDLLQSIQLRTFDIFAISLCAGISEELFFRATIQPWLGVWITSILFVALHGYLDPRNWKLSIVGCFMVLVAAGLGYLFIFAGIMAAIIAHMVFDLIMLFYYVKLKKGN
ncbi:MAG: CPBP family intramembrane metalloprotease [Bacteroidia bacterium]|nr:CPBP family intramembrane metalloprotease [Bacteroidia bacterium]